MADISAELQAIPGADLVERGIADLKRERDSIEALVVSIGAPRLAMAGISVPPRSPPQSTSSTPDWRRRRQTALTPPTTP